MQADVDTATFSDYLEMLNHYGAGSMKVAPQTADGEVLAVMIVATGEEAQMLSDAYDKWTDDEGGNDGE